MATLILLHIKIKKLLFKPIQSVSYFLNTTKRFKIIDTRKKNEKNIILIIIVNKCHLKYSIRLKIFS